MIFNPKYECMDREQLRALQSERLIKTVRTCYEKSPFYRKKMDETGVKPDDIKSIDDIHKLPFTTKIDLRDEYPFGLQVVPQSEVVRIHASSGTTGKPVVATYTKNDLDVWSEGVARVMSAGGVTKDDIVQVSYGYGLFTGGLGAHDGALKIGATQLPTSSGNTKKQIMLMKDFGTTALCATPSYAMHIAEAIENSHTLSLDDMKLKVGFFGAEPWSNGMRKTIEKRLRLKAIDIYGLTEISGPGVGGECEYQDGIHIWEDFFYPEIINPETLQPVPEGVFGELVFTTLCKEAMPILRYRTRDLTRIRYEKCKCGRTAARIDRIFGRSDDMLIIRGVNVFPSQIETCLTEFPAFQPYYFITVDRINHEDSFEIKVELRPEFYVTPPEKQLVYVNPLYKRIVSVTGIKPSIKVVPPMTLERSEGKAKHVLDMRKYDD
ncbi:MAG: phenylacetate--CoA ligase [Bacteroidales bacterium]|nr:phenylacetate--CoA ligase [Bacteroidales bacterium]